MPIHTLTPRRRKRAIDGARRTRTYLGAAAAAGVSRIALWRWRKDDPEFDQELEDAMEDFDDKLESHANVILMTQLEAMEEDVNRYDRATVFRVLEKADKRWRRETPAQTDADAGGGFDPAVADAVKEAIALRFGELDKDSES